jgi:hypothetical protein
MWYRISGVTFHTVTDEQNLQHWFEDLTVQIQDLLTEVGLNQDNIDDFVELLLGIGFLSLQSCLHFRVHHQVSVDDSGGQQATSNEHSASISSVHVL